MKKSVDYRGGRVVLYTGTRETRCARSLKTKQETSIHKKDKRSIKTRNIKSQIKWRV